MEKQKKFTTEATESHREKKKDWNTKYTKGKGKEHKE
jgi:hypothetical protein